MYLHPADDRSFFKPGPRTNLGPDVASTCCSAFSRKDSLALLFTLIISFYLTIRAAVAD